MSLIKKILPLILGVLFPITLHANDSSRFPSSKITEKQWQTYFDEIKIIEGAKSYELNRQVIIELQDSTIIYVFTSLDHFAYPAVIIRRVAEKDGKVIIAMSGYFASSQIEFDKWWKQFEALNDSLRNKMNDNVESELI